MSAKEQKAQERNEALRSSESLLTEIFTTFREANAKGSDGFQELKDKIAEYAGRLVALDLSSLKDLVDILMKLNSAGKGSGEEEGNERRFQEFLRKKDDGEDVA